MRVQAAPGGERANGGQCAELQAVGAILLPPRTAMLALALRTKVMVPVICRESRTASHLNG